LNIGVPVEAGVPLPPKAGVDELAWFAPKRGPEEFAAPVPDAAPNWKEGVAPPAGVEAPPKPENIPPVAGAAEEAGLSPDENGLFTGAAEVPPEKLKLKPPEPAFEDAPPKLTDVLAGALPVLFVAEPNKLPDGWIWAFPKLKVGAAAPAAVPPANGFLAGEGSSCFMGLPLNRDPPAWPVVGDLGAPKRGLGAD